MRRGVRIGYVQVLGLLVSAGRDRSESNRPDATSPDAPFEGAAGMQARLLSRPSNSTHAYRVRQIRQVPIASAGHDRVLVL